MTSPPQIVAWVLYYDAHAYLQTLSITIAMFSFLQGFAYGLLITCTPWLVIGMLNPRLALPYDPPRRWQVVVRYGLMLPFISVVLLILSLFGGLFGGGFNPSLFGWLVGLLAIPISLYVERRWSGWQTTQTRRQRQAQRQRAAAKRRAAKNRHQQEAGLHTLNPQHPPADADEIVLALCASKQRLLTAQRPDLALAADRIYTRYRHVNAVIASKFDPQEMTFERAITLVMQVCRSAVDDLHTMASLAHGTLSIDAEFVRRRLSREGERLATEERDALQRRLDLVTTTEQRLRELAGRIEAALTALDDTAVAVSAIETARPQASVAADQALHDLRRFSERVPSYGRDD